MPLRGEVGQAPLNACHVVPDTDGSGKTIVTPVFPNGVYIFRPDMEMPRVDKPFLSPRSVRCRSVSVLEKFDERFEELE